MTDEQMDARLRSAGEAWRAATAPAEEITPVEPHNLTTPETPRPHRPRTGLLISAAAVAAAVVAGSAALVSHLAGNGHHAAADTVPLEQTVWQFVGYGDQLDNHSFSTLYISSDGRLVADDECELLSAHADPAGGRLDVSGIAERFKGCVDTYQPSFGHGRELLDSDPTYAITADGLTLGAGAQAMHFLPAANLPAPTLDVPMLADTDWRLTSATDADGNVSTVDGDLRFRVEAGRYTADEGCNTFSGDLTDRGAQANIKTVESTALPCPSPLPYQQVMQSVFQPGAADVQVRGAELTIKGDGAGSLTYHWIPTDADATRPSALIGHDWQLASVAGAPAAGNVGLYAGPRELSVTFGCGAVGGDAQIGHGTLHVDGIRGGNAPGCSGDVGDQSATVDSIIAGEALWRVADGKLIVFGGAGAQGFALVFTAADQPAPADVPLVGTDWSLTKILDADKHELPVAGGASLLITGADHLTANDGCNAISGNATVGRTTIGFSGLATTEMGCADGRGQSTADRVDATLAGDVTWSIDGDELAISKDGVGTLVYQATPPTSTSTDPSDLIGVTWYLTTVETGTGPNSVAQSAEPLRLRIADAVAGLLELPDICRHATVDVGQGTLDIGTVQSTSPDCNRAQSHADDVLTALSGKVSWVIAGDQLTITKDGVGALV
jgi:heat shock protein HslJ